MKNRRIETYETLSRLVDLDKSDHLIKQLAELFLTAMRGWPTWNQESISEYMTQLKVCFGEPLTSDRIESKLFNGINSWQQESSESLLEMQKLWYKYNGPKILEDLIHKVLLHYERQFVDFIAELHYLPTDKGGRKTPAASGYRPQVKFAFAEYQTSGQQTFIDKEIVFPGDTVLAKIAVISPQILNGRLEEEMKFDFREGPKIVGTGRVKIIINDKLEKKM